MVRGVGVGRRYQKKSREFHPDRNRGDVYATARFQRINDAFSVLADPKRREAYNRTRRLRADGRDAAQ